MTDIKQTEISTESLVDRVSHDPAIRRELDLAVRELGADKTDVNRILPYLDDRVISLQRVPGLFGKACRRLLRLRHTLAEFTTLNTLDPETSDLVRQFETALQPGDVASLDEACELLNEIWGLRLSRDDHPETDAMVCAMQALTAAIIQAYPNSAQYYADAAATPGLDNLQKWQYQIDRALVLEDYGRDYGNNPALEQAVSLLENETTCLVSKQQKQSEWATTQHVLGNILGVLGQRQTGTRNLQNSIAAIQASLSVRDREAEPLQWADTQNSLGIVLGILGHRQNDREMLAEAAAALERSLEERTREIASQDRTTTQNNLAAVMQSLGQRNKDARMLKRSVETYKEVLKEWTRKRTPEKWATTMDNMGTALRLLGEYRKGPRTLEQSVAAYNSALAERSRDRLPQEWAMTQNNLGAALQKLGERDTNPEIFGKAVTAYENALKEWTRDSMPMAWAMTMANLGVARRILAEAIDDVDQACKAVEELDAVSDFFRSASHAQYSELVIDQLAQARKLVDVLYRDKGKYADLVPR